MLRKTLLGCGAVSSALYIATDIVAARRYPGYRYTEYSISEAIAVAAPTRRFWLAMSIPYNLLVTALGAGIWAGGAEASRKSGTARATGAALLGYAASSMVGGLRFPLLAPREIAAPEPQGTRRARQHMLATGVINLFFMLSMGFGATLFGKRFRAYSYGTIATLLVFGALTGLYVPRLSSNQPTPGLGIVERVNVYTSMLWVAVLSLGLLRAQRATAPQSWGTALVAGQRTRAVLQRVLR